MHISYQLYNVNNLNYKFDNTIIKTDKISESYQFNIKSTTITVDRSNNITIIHFDISVTTTLSDGGEVFRDISFDFNYVFSISDYNNLSDDQIREFIIEHGLESALAGVKDTILKISNIDYQPKLVVDIPEFPIRTSLLPNEDV
ncbi:hypothetical protein [Leuconostoc mesenteroides]|uniref:hypothetical protein n=1 Tax=Leuconostoc mesenteroides TaxID=1245 RepID=UPI002078E7CA|nr:hypothetical protein [Leuconostoc mesenteroides]USI45363.1 hypothetical protein M0D19_07660 [Leuconostoc mesenteroides]